MFFIVMHSVAVRAQWNAFLYLFQRSREGSVLQQPVQFAVAGVSFDVMKVYCRRVSKATVNTNLFRLKFFPSLGKTDPLNFGSGNYRCFVFLVIGS